jgi:hypothetical protein
MKFTFSAMMAQMATMRTIHLSMVTGESYIPP